MIKRLLCAFAALALPAGCMMPQQVSGVPEHIRTVGVASSLSPNLLLTSDITRQSIDWDLNGKLVREASALLQDRYKVVPFVVNPTDNNRTQSAVERLRAVAAPGVADIILLAEAPLSLVNQFETSPLPAGPNDAAAYLIRHELPKPLFAPSEESRIFSMFGISYQWTVLDGQTFKPLARSVAVIPPERNLVEDALPRQTGGFTLARSDADIGWLGAPDGEMSQSQRDTIDTELMTVLSDSVATTLYRLKLADRSVLKVYDTDLPAGPTTATLVGSRNETPALQKDVLTHIAAIDGRSTMLGMKQFEKAVAVPAGRHSVRVYAAQKLFVDGLSTVTATFEPGRRYVLRASRIDDAAPLPKLVFDCCDKIPTPSAWIEDSATGEIVSDVVPMKVRNVESGLIFIPARAK